MCATPLRASIRSKVSPTPTATGRGRRFSRPQKSTTSKSRPTTGEIYSWAAKPRSANAQGDCGMATKTSIRPDPAELVHEAKEPVTRIAGPYGHPFHPILVTVPIGAWVASLVFDILSRTADNGADFARGAYWLIAIGVIGALAAALFGLLDLLAIPRRTRAWRVG